MSNEQKSIWDNESATQAQPAQTQPAQTQPAQTQSAQTQPSQTQPAQTPREVTVSLDDVEDIADNRK